MKFKELFDKDFLVAESHVRKTLKIFYELNLNLIKANKDASEQNQDGQQPVQQQPVQNTPVDQQPAPAPEQQVDTGVQAPQPIDQPGQAEPEAQNLGSIQMPSVYTEDEVSVNNENRIMRKFEGVVELSDSQKDNIQTFDDIIEVLRNYKKDGNEILDDFSAEVITMLSAQKFNEVKQMLDKKSKIFVEVYYGFNKQDSVGVRFNKREISDSITSTMLIDNEIVSAKFSIDMINRKIADYRNYEINK